MDGVGCLPLLLLLQQQLSLPRNSAVRYVDAGENETSVDQCEVQGGDLISDSKDPCAAAAAAVGQPDPSKGPRESYEWLGNDLVVDHVDVDGTDHLHHLLPVQLGLQHHLDKHP